MFQGSRLALRFADALARTVNPLPTRPESRWQGQCEVMQAGANVSTACTIRVCGRNRLIGMSNQTQDHTPAR